MEFIRKWWSNGLSPWVKFVYLVLLANGLPAFVILMSAPAMTDILFVWTVKPPINAHLMGVMYFNALLLVAFGAVQTSWARARITMVVITLFSILATLLTFVYLKPFLAHPWYHLTFWLTMYLILFFTAPVVFYTQEKKYGGRLPVQLGLDAPARLLAGAALLISLVCALGFLFRVDLVNQLWPWKLTPLVAGLIGVLFTTHAAAYAWTLWDGDWLRVRPMFWQAPLTLGLLMLLPLLHQSDLRPDAGASLRFFYLFAGTLVLAFALIILRYRSREQKFASPK